MVSKKLNQDKTPSGKISSFFLWVNGKCLIKLKAVTMSSVTIIEGFVFSESIQLYHSMLFDFP